MKARGGSVGWTTDEFQGVNSYRRDGRERPSRASGLGFLIKVFSAETTAPSRIFRCE